MTTQLIDRRIKAERQQIRSLRRARKYVPAVNPDLIVGERHAHQRAIDLLKAERSSR